MKTLFKVPKKELLSDKYSHKICTPQYVPNNKMPKLEELADYSKYSKLIADINSSHVSEEEKKFLKYAATRHLVFRYDKIADYYAHATAEMQRLMEKSALVIVDFEDAILNGYVELTKEIDSIVRLGSNDEE